jgi:hypothetical protein
MQNEVDVCKVDQCSTGFSRVGTCNTHFCCTVAACPLCDTFLLLPHVCCMSSIIRVICRTAAHGFLPLASKPPCFQCLPYCVYVCPHCSSACAMAYSCMCTTSVATTCSCPCSSTMPFVTGASPIAGGCLQKLLRRSAQASGLLRGCCGQFIWTSHKRWVGLVLGPFDGFAAAEMKSRTARAWGGQLRHIHTAAVAPTEGSKRTSVSAQCVLSTSQQQPSALRCRKTASC